MAELPYLKNKDGGGTGMATVTVRPSDHTDSKRMLEMVAEELMESFLKKDRGGFMQALRAFCMMMEDEDE